MCVKRLRLSDGAAFQFTPPSLLPPISKQKEKKIMTAIISAAVIFVVFAVGDMISAKTKAIVSTVSYTHLTLPTTERV